MSRSLKKIEALKAKLDAKYGPIADYVIFDIVPPSKSFVSAAYEISVHTHEDTVWEFTSSILKDMKVLAGLKASLEPMMATDNDRKPMKDKTKTPNDLIDQARRKIFMHAVKKAQMTDVVVPALPKIKVPRGPRYRHPGEGRGLVRASRIYK